MQKENTMAKWYAIEKYAPPADKHLLFVSTQYKIDQFFTGTCDDSNAIRDDSGSLRQATHWKRMAIARKYYKSDLEVL